MSDPDNPRSRPHSHAPFGAERGHRPGGGLSDEARFSAKWAQFTEWFEARAEEWVRDWHTQPLCVLDEAMRRLYLADKETFDFIVDDIRARKGEARRRRA